MAGYFSKVRGYFRGWACVLFLVVVVFWAGLTVHMYLTVHRDVSRLWQAELSFGIACDLEAVRPGVRKSCVSADEVIDRHEAIRRALFWKAMKHSAAATLGLGLLGGLLYLPVWLIRRRRR